LVIAGIWANKTSLHNRQSHCSLYLQSRPYIHNYFWLILPIESCEVLSLFLILYEYLGGQSICLHAKFNKNGLNAWKPLSKHGRPGWQTIT
jgi:hypothetical protein